MSKSDLSQLSTKLRLANARLKAANTRVAIQQRGKSLVLVATLPPKPNSHKSRPHQQRLSLGIPANPIGLKRAEDQARLLGAQLAAAEFNWSQWGYGDRPAGSGHDAATMIAAFQKKTGLNDYTFRERYLYFGLNKLPMSAPVTADLIVAAVLTKAPDTRARQTACERMGRFAEFCGIEVDLSGLVGDYGRGSVTEKEPPTEAVIESVLSKIQNERWRNVFWRMAVYGCRDHEAFFSQIEDLDGVLVLRVLEGKTGSRFPVFPVPQHWAANCGDLLPQLNVTEHSEFGQRTSAAWRRQTDELNWTPYDLRRAYAVRCHLAGIPTAIAAAWMGHSEATHTQIYRRWIVQENHLKAYREAFRN